MGRPCIVVIVSLLLLAMGGFAFGTEFGNIHFGRLYVHPRLGVEATYDDNIFLLGKSEEDVLFKIRPGIDLDYMREGKAARLNYLAEIGRYVDNSDYDYDNHLVDAAVDLQFPSGLMFFVGDNFRTANDRLTYEWIPLVKRKQNTGDAKIGYEFTDRLSVQAGYDHVMIDYDDPKYSAYDRDEDMINGTVFYRILNAVSVLAQFEYRQIDYDVEGVRYDSDGVGGWVGVTGQITPKTVALIKGGWQERDYDGPHEDWDGGVISLDIVHRCTETLTLTAGASREAVESAYLTNNYFTSTQGRVGLEKKIGPKIVAGVSGFYANSDYPEKTSYKGGMSERDDDIWGISARVGYSIQRWLSASLSYTHEARDSNQDTFDYDDNRVSVGVSAIF
jgi:hypothetical protein